MLKLAATLLLAAAAASVTTRGDTCGLARDTCGHVTKRIVCGRDTCAQRAPYHALISRVGTPGPATGQDNTSGGKIFDEPPKNISVQVRGISVSWRARRCPRSAAARWSRRGGW